MDRISNGWVRELRVVKKGVQERMDESILGGFEHFERMGNSKTSKYILISILRNFRWLGKGG